MNPAEKIKDWTQKTKQFYSDVRSEMKKVSWPARQEARHLPKNVLSRLCAGGNGDHRKRRPKRPRLAFGEEHTPGDGFCRLGAESDAAQRRRGPTDRLSGVDGGGSAETQTDV